MNSQKSTITKQGNSIDAESSDFNGADFQIERYKYILNEIHTLNENFHSYLTLFQTLATAIVGAGVGLLVGWQGLKISPEIAIAGIRSLLGLLILITIFIIFSMLASISSWIDYRREEVELLDQAIKPGFRKPPKLGNFWRWHETYLILFIIVFTIAILLYTQNLIIPLIK